MTWVAHSFYARKRNPFSAWQKIRIWRNNICQLVLAKSYGINETMVTIKQISNENIIISWEQHIFWRQGNILQVQFRYENVSCNIPNLVCFLLLIIVHSSQTCTTQTLSYYELWRRSVIICASDSSAASDRSLSKPQDIIEYLWHSTDVYYPAKYCRLKTITFHFNWIFL